MKTRLLTKKTTSDWRLQISSLMILAGILLASVCLTGCGGAFATSPVTGFLYTDVKGPVDVGDSPTYNKQGTGSVRSLLGLIAIGDASIQNAARNGGITKIHHVDYHSKSVLAIFAVYTVTVYGE